MRRKQNKSTWSHQHRAWPRVSANECQLLSSLSPALCLWVPGKWTASLRVYRLGLPLWEGWGCHCFLTFVTVFEQELWGLSSTL